MKVDGLAVLLILSLLYVTGVFVTSYLELKHENNELRKKLGISERKITYLNLATIVKMFKKKKELRWLKALRLILGSYLRRNALNVVKD